MNIVLCLVLFIYVKMLILLMLLLFIYFVEFNSLGLLVCNEFIYNYEILFFIGRSGFVVELVGLSMFVLIWLEKLVV